MSPPKEQDCSETRDGKEIYLAVHPSENLYIKNNVGSTTAITAIKRGDGTNFTVGATATTAGTFTANQFYYLQYRGTSPNYTSILFDAEIY